MELEREEQEALEAKNRERAERKTKRDERHRRHLSEPDAQKSKSRLERELEIQVYPFMKEVDCSFRVMFLILL